MSEFTREFKTAVKGGFSFLSPPEIAPDERMPKLAAYLIVATTLGLSTSVLSHGYWLPVLIPAPRILGKNIQLAFNTVSADLEEKAATLAAAPARLRRFIANHV